VFPSCPPASEPPGRAGLLSRFLRHPATALVFLLLVTVLLLWNNWSIPLWDQDEAAYAGFGRVMRQSGDLVVPQFAWSEPHRKTPLQFWLIALATAALGESEFSLRLPSAIAVLGTILLVVFAGRRIFGTEWALLSGMILGCSPLVTALGKVAVTDGVLLFFETLCGLAVLRIMIGGGRRWVGLFWLAFACGVMQKGPPIVLFTGMLGGLLAAFHPQRRRLLALRPWVFLPLALLPLLAWGWSAWQRDGGVFVRWLVDWYVLRRANMPVFRQSGPPGYYLATFFVVFLPVLAFLPSAARLGVASWRSRAGPVFPIACWAASGWLVYEFMASKLPVYAAASYPAIALLLARAVLDIAENPERRRSWALRVSALVQVVACASLGAALVAGAARLPVGGQAVAAAAVVSAALVLSSVAAFVLIARNAIDRAVLWMIGGGLCVLMLCWGALGPFVGDARGSSRMVAAYAERNARPDSEIVIANGGGRPPSLPWYLGRHFEHVTVDVPSDALRSRLSSAEPAVLILTAAQLQALDDAAPELHRERVRGMASDRGGALEYWILINAAARKE
jgi:4-amino-4-deoxy-L-arabinose transferase-like glycosyltransferase